MKTAVPVFAHHRVSPTDLVYLCEDCRRCFYDKVVNGFKPPRSFSEHFTNADRAMRRALATDEVVDIGVGPRFRVLSQGEWVQSKPILFAESGVTLSFRGQYDAVVVTESDEVFVVDYKTTTLDDHALMKFRRQLMCYVTAIELPASGESNLPAYVEGTALLVFEPAHFAINVKTKRCGLYGPTRWVELPRRNDLFDEFLCKVAAVLADPIAPLRGINCGVCALRFGESYTPLKSLA